MEVVRVLMLGMEGAGKTLLLRRLHYVTQVMKTKPEKFSADVVSTAGVELVQIPLGKKTVIQFRELGGCMMPLWPEYYEECSMLVYVVDAGNPFSLVEAGIQLHDMVQDPGLQGKPVAVVINKVDAPSVIGSKDIEHALMLPVLEGLGITLQVLHTSALTGDGASDFLQWIVEHAAIHNG